MKSEERLAEKREQKKIVSIQQMAQKENVNKSIHNS